MSDMPLATEEVTHLLIYPFYAVTAPEQLAYPHILRVSKEKWIEANVNLIGTLGAKVYLQYLLQVLEGSPLSGIVVGPP